MKLLSILAMISFLPAAALAQGQALAADGTPGTGDHPEAVAQAPAGETPGNGAADSAADDAAAEDDPGLLVLDAAEADLDSFLWVRRPLVIFANTPADPAFEQQMRAITDRADEFHQRDVVVITDTDPRSGSQARQRLRPRGFMVVIIDKDGEVKQRRPAPRSARELMAVIDRFPLRRQEMLERSPSGRD